MVATLWMLVLALAVLATACATTVHLRKAPHCFDGLPPEVLTDPRCPPDGICGYSCLPNRWAISGPRHEEP